MTLFNYNYLKKKNSSYIIAEIGVNHGCSISKAKKMILLAKKGGAHAAKFQSYKAKKIVKYKSQAYWDIKKEKIKSQFELFSKLDKFQPNDYRILSIFCKRNKIDFLSTPFDLESVKFLNPLVPAFKISSSDITNIPLIEKISKTKKPVILSTGASNLQEIENAIKILKKGTDKIIIMHCILNYPTKDQDANLHMISDLKKKFPKYIIGYSDHTSPNSNMINLTTAYILGAKVIEKHFTYNKTLSGNDHYHSMDLADLKILTKNIEYINKILGKIFEKKVLKSELKSRKFARRSIVLNNDVKKNSKIKENDIIALRPNIGISIEKWKNVLGKRVNKDLKKNKTLSWKDIK